MDQGISAFITLEVFPETFEHKFLVPKLIGSLTPPFGPLWYPVATRLYNTFFVSCRVSIVDDRSSTYINELRKVVTTNVNMVVAIVPDAKADRYGAIKKFLSCDNAGNF